MTGTELLSFLAANRHIEMYDDLENHQLCFRNSRLPWYKNHPTGCTAITYARMDGLNDVALMRDINRGLEVEGITRITGYMAKVSSWNPGKLGELKDRRRTDLHGNPAHISIPEINELQAICFAG